MAVNSFNFLVFFFVVFVVYYLPWMSQRKGSQTCWLFLSSYFFYGFVDWKMIFLLLGSTLIFYALGFWLKKEMDKQHSKNAFRITALGIVLGVGVLFYFKYLNFFAESIANLLRSIGLNVTWSTLNIVLPIGVSFFTFKLISYIIEIYRKNIEPCKDFIVFGTYIAFFPTILSGPIDRPNSMIPQLGGAKIFNYSLAVEGCRQILWGMFMKMCVADRLASYVDYIVNDPSSHSGTSILLAVLLYPIQIYADFAGYSEMAIGVGAILGIKVMQNFKRPYLSINIREFWRGWHISLISWFRDYIYFPLGGSRCSKLKNIRNVLIVWAVSGLWHGANWTFLLWGLYHGVLFIPSIVSKFFSKKSDTRYNDVGLPVFVDWMKIFGVYLLVAFGWILFRADSIGHFGTLVSGIVGRQDLRNAIQYDKGPAGATYLIVTLFFVIILSLKDIKDAYLKDKIKLFENSFRWVRWTAYYVIVVLIFWYGINGGSKGSFIYFNF